jgi:predicted lipase
VLVIRKQWAYVARDDVSQLIIVAIQGTSTVSNPTDFVTDIDIIQWYSSLCGSANKVDGCSVHDGFHRTMKDAANVVNSVVAAAEKDYPSYRIVTTGHSFGGAIAALLGTELRNEGQIVDIVSYVQDRRVSKWALIIHSTPLASLVLEVAIYQDISKAKRP